MHVCPKSQSLSAVASKSGTRTSPSSLMSLLNAFLVDIIIFWWWRQLGRLGWIVWEGGREVGREGGREGGRTREGGGGCCVICDM